ncbi:hypothetical protein Dalk_2113 [Desulfatibacillum aliphaticivorans]|uniref:Uncharacterized protein n=1 Tax=Desulfatibacillum aliphaticivorans TaxID=218208 RepID=B8FGC7_DESAL|nr:hypothetical protein [Desulfatibacillum aliphaticivorans]ACL03807.1 hypothetical protein Dalk_2113 [Desulfatibacillum aliphaticivorans]
MYNNAEYLDNGGDAGIESAQTDVLRFNVIIAYILLVLAPIVPSFPQEAPTAIIEVQKQAQAFEDQKVQISELHEQNKELMKQVDALLLQAEENQKEADSLDLAKRTLKTQEEKIQALQAEKQMQAERIWAYKRQLDRRQKEIADISSKLNAMENAFQEPKTDEREEVQTKQPSERKKGVYVAFESDEAFLSLLQEGQVQLFFHINESTAFQVFAEGKGIRFKAAALPENLPWWGIQESLVPPAISESFQTWTTLALQHKTAIITLPDSISEKIRNLQGKNGEFIIGRNGETLFIPYDGGQNEV